VNSKEIFAYAGKIMRINLTSGEITIKSTLDYAKDWLGGSGIAIKILYDELKPWVTPYEPANKIIFSSGPLIGTVAPGACKMNVSTLGPMIGGWATGSSDSYVGMQLKFAGYDAIIVEGKARVPVYLWIHNNKIEVKSAERLWGKSTWETLDVIRKELSDDNLHILSIGPAGENLVRGACIIQDKGRAFGRCGSGAVMGSKNLKAIVADGNQPVRIADSKKFMKKVMEYRKMIIPEDTNENSGSEGHFIGSIGTTAKRKYGSLDIIGSKQAVSGIPFKNFQEGSIPDNIVDRINPKQLIDKYQIYKQNYPSCPIGCSRYLYINEGPYAGLVAECPQWEAFATLQARLAIEEPTFVVKANAYCNQLGLDVDAAGGAIGWAMECYQRGILNERDTDGLKLNWGDEGVALELIRKISYREGFGNILAEGCKRASDIIGRNSSYYAMNIKGQDLYENCRGMNAWCLGVVTSTRGGGHTTGTPGCELSSKDDSLKLKKIFGISNAIQPQEYNGKARMVYITEILHRVCNSLGICHYTTIWGNLNYINLAHIAEMYSAATGIKIKADDLEKIAVRQLNLEKAFNLMHTNYDRKDDLPTQRDLNEPIKGGGLAGWKIDKNKFNQMLDEYYELHGWNKETSFPTRKILKKLGLEYVAGDLENIGKLGKLIE